MRELWRETVGRMPAGWFTLELQPVLEEYCRNVCYCRDLTVWLDTVDVLSLEDEDELKKHALILAKYRQAVSTVNLLTHRLRLSGTSQRDAKGDLYQSVKGTGASEPGHPWDATREDQPDLFEEVH